MNLISFLPELFYFLALVLFLGLSLARPLHARRYHLAALSLAAMGMIICLASVRFQDVLFLQTYRVDLFSQVFKVMLSMGLFLIVCICSDLSSIEKRLQPEFYLLLFTCTLAMMMLVSAVHLLVIYVSLELSSYSLYILVALRRDGRIGVEAGIKYFVVGIVASAIMLFGMALLYAFTQAVYLQDIMRLLPDILNAPMVLIGLLLTMVGFFFKLAVFPFHFWAPDVYQGAANQVAGYIATASKVAAIAILIRMTASSNDGQGFLVHALVALAILSMTVGNLTAIVQKDFKRLLAYSSIAHGGYVLIGLISMSSNGYAAAIFYAMAVLVLKFTCFLVVVQVAQQGCDLEIRQLAGLHRRAPLSAMALMLALFGLAGIPPTIGFTGKLLIFTAAMEQGYLVLVLIAMINVVISLYYYLLVLKAAYLLEPEHGHVQVLPHSPGVKVLTGLLIVVIVAAGIFPSYLIEIARAAARAII